MEHVRGGSVQVTAITHLEHTQVQLLEGEGGNEGQGGREPVLMS
jgi:hypothetical protein